MAGLQARLRRDMANAQWLLDASPPDAALGACWLRCRCRPCASATSLPGSTGEALDAHTQAWADRINRSGAAYLTPAILDGRWMVRVSIGALLTEREHVERLWELMRTEAELA